MEDGPRRLEDDIANPPHYTSKGHLQPMHVIEDWELKFYEGCILKYLYRWQHRGTPIKDLEKLRQYADMLLCWEKGRQ